MPRGLRIAAWVAGGLVAILLAAVAGLTIALDAGALTPRLLATIEAATGRSASLGAVSLRPGLTPRLVAEDATLANLPGGSRPEMARIRRLEAKLALLPLLRGEVAFGSIVIDGADILLERLPDGTPNWVLRAPAQDPAPAATPAEPRSPAAARRLSIAEAVLTDSTIAFPGILPAPVAIGRLRITSIGGDGPAAATARLEVAGTALTLEAETGPIPPPPAAPWPIRARMAAGANAITAEGSAQGPVAVSAMLPEPAALLPLLAALAPGVAPPPLLPPIEAALTLGPDRRPADLLLRLGAADLGALRSGLALRHLEARAAALDRPLNVTAEVVANGLPLAMTLRLDTLAVLLAGGAGGPVVLTAEATSGAARASATGRIGDARRLRGMTLDLRLAAPDLAALAPLIPGVPAGETTLEARLAAPEGLSGPVRLGPFSVAAPALRAEGDITWRPGSPPGLDGRIAAARIDLDALAARPAAPAPAASPPGAPAQPAAPAPAADGRVIPDRPLPLALARAFNGRIEVTVDHLLVGGTDWRQGRGTLALADGTARLAPFAAVTPGGPVRGEASLDATATPPALSIALRSEGAGIDLAALRGARQEAPGIEGRAEIRLDLRGRGATTRAVAATLTGEAGLAVVGGRLARAGMLRLGPDLVGVLLPGVPQDGLEIRCLALRASAEDGMVNTPALLLETAAGRIEGVVAVNLGTEALAARLLPDITLFGVRVRAPVGVGGTLAAPRVSVEPGRAAAQVIGDAVANRLWRDPTVEWLRGRATGSPQAGDCAAQLRIARFGADGPVPPAQRVVPIVPRELQGTTQDVVRGLGGAIGGAIGGILGGRR